MKDYDLNQSSPLVSVVMTVRNGSRYIKQALNSVIHQTFSNFEVIIIDDGSTDDTVKLVKNLRDPRISIYSHENRGVARSSNRGIALARGEYIARIDHDDVWFPDRLEKQLIYLADNLEVGLVGSAAVIWKDDMVSGHYLDHPVGSAMIRWALLFNNPFVHSSILFRREILKKIGLYDPTPDVAPFDDYHFLSRVASFVPVANLSDRLVAYREVKKSLSSNFRSEDNRQSSLHSKTSAKISSENIATLNGLPYSDATCQQFGALTHLVAAPQNARDLIAIERLLLRSIDKIKESYPRDYFNSDELFPIAMDNLIYNYRNLNASRIALTIFLLNSKNSVNHPRLLNRKKDILFQSVEKTYWCIREYIYFKLYIFLIVKLLKSYFGSKN